MPIQLAKAKSVSAMWLSMVMSALLVLFMQTAAASEYFKIQHQGVERYALVRAPASLVGTEKLPLVLVLHGGGGNAENIERMTGFTALAQRERFIVVYPEGRGRFDHKLLTWNAGHCCGPAMQQRSDDVGFIRALLLALKTQYPIDAQRVYVTGISNGGMMAHRLGFELADDITAIAPVVATLFGDERLPATPVSALIINGMQDQSVPFDGGAPGGRFPDAWDGTPALPAMAQAEFWAKANACAATVNVSNTPLFQHGRYACPPDVSLQFYFVRELGHAWPGGRKGSWRGDEPGQALDATTVIWTFFEPLRR